MSAPGGPSTKGAKPPGVLASPPHCDTCKCARGAPPRLAFNVNAPGFGLVIEVDRMIWREHTLARWKEEDARDERRG